MGEAMSKAFKCDHCHEYFSQGYGTYRFEGEVLAARGGWVSYRIVGLVYGAKGPPRGLDGSDKELCDACVKEILTAALVKGKL